jgi:hypothetical protein
MRWGIWWFCFTAFIFLIQILVHPLAKIHWKWRTLATLIMSLIFVVICQPIEHAQWREEMAAKLEGNLTGGDKPELLENGAIPWLQIADTKTVEIMTPNGKGQPYFSPFKDDADFLVESGTKGPLISTVVRDRGGNMVVEIKQNHWRVYPPYCSDKNYTDRAFEAKDSSGHVLIQFRFIGGPPRVQVQGEWWSNESRGIRVVKDAHSNGYVVPLFPDNQRNDLLIKPIFKYASKDYWGEFDSNSALSDIMPKF